jgi:hypothetical protein
MNPLLSIDATFPLFIAAELPMGVTGLIIAGIFAAAMSTLSSIINSVATLVSVDFYEKLVKNPAPERSVRFAEWMTVVVGLVGIGVALLLSRYDIQSLFDVSIELARRGHRHRIGDRAHRLVLDAEPGAPLLLPGDLDPAVHRDRLHREPVLPGARAVAEGLDGVRVGARRRPAMIRSRWRPVFSPPSSPSPTMARWRLQRGG